LKDSIELGLNFGLTSGVITTLGLMVGLHSGTHSQLAVIGGIITIAIADAMSDALGIHVSREAENAYTERQVWVATLVTFGAKLLMACTFMLPVLVFALDQAIVVSVVWGLGVLALLSYRIARDASQPPLKVVAEHLLIAAVVITLTHYLGDWVARTFV
jgi:VIT1/CCC1 family predicted Fe2+/Mn2+ transporter